RPERRGIIATDSYTWSLNRVLTTRLISFPYSESSSFERLLVQKLPPAVKKGKEGSVLPRIISPHMHSRMGYPSESQTISSQASRWQTQFSSSMKSSDKPSVTQ